MPQIWAPVASAENSRWREIESWMIEAAIGASKTSAKRGDQAERALVVAAEPHQHVAEVGDRAADRRRDGLDQGVAVADVGELVGDDAAQLVGREQLGDPAR